MSDMEQTLTLIVEPCKEGGYTAFVPEIPGAISEGETVDAARDNVLDALRELLAYRREKALASTSPGAVVSALPHSA